MRHLHSDELIDLAEGTRPAASAPHLQECQICRSQLADLQAVMSVARDVDVPEPSPLYWGHFSARVRDAVAAEGVPRRYRWFEGWSWSDVRVPGWVLSAGAVAVLLVTALTVARLERAPADSNGSSSAAGVLADIGSSTEPGALSTDSSLDLVADLTQDMDWDSAREDGFAPRQDAVERALDDLSDVERRELRRLLKEELSRSN
jgi:hypothetical protein